MVPKNSERWKITITLRTNNNRDRGSFSKRLVKNSTRLASTNASNEKKISIFFK